MIDRFVKELVERLEEKIKVTSLEIIVTGTKDKPYFEIKYKEVGKEDYNIGYSSYDLNNVLGWKEECFEIVNQLAEESNNGWITDRIPTKEECKNNRFWITDSDRWCYEADFDLECERWRDLETGGFINVIAWYMLPLPAPYQKK